MNLRSLLVLAATSTFFVVAACADSADPDASGTAGSGTAGSGTSGSGTAGSGTSGSGTAGSGTAGSGTSGSGTAGSAPSGALVLNEVSGAGDDWVELKNVGTTPFDLSGVGVTDAASPGKADTAGAFRFPAGTMLPAGGYVLVWGDHAMSDNQPKTDCPPGGPTTCFHAAWKVSATDGEDVFALDAKDAVLDATTFPAGTADGVTWARLPDGTGAFAAAKPTPGAANAK